MSKGLKATVLVDNIANGDVKGEWGLSIEVEYNNTKFLIDAGTTSLVVDNAKALGVDLSKIDYAILSHAHYDHSGGFKAFFEENKTAKLYLRNTCKENCYTKKDTGIEYIGIQEGLLEDYKDRLEFIDGVYKLSEGVTLVPHADCPCVGKTTGMLVKENGEFINDNFSHEHSIVFDTDKGLVVFDACCHGGMENVINEVKNVFNGKEIYAFIGGLHMFRLDGEQITKIVDGVSHFGISRIVTGHCTGDLAFDIFKEKMGDVATKMYVGMQIEI